ncbi:MAG: Type PLP-dependent enzyme [Patescibacteria group bacterium]|nr:Type PLP-dependent enzyme [Patescibacteria group bacterium]
MVYLQELVKQKGKNVLKKEQQAWITRLKGMPHKTPFMVTDLAIVHENAKVITEALPRVGIYYAIKSNSDERIIETIDPIVAGYDIASLGEYKHLKNLGVASERMLYSNPVKIPEHIQKTYEGGVRHFAFDSMDEISKLSTYAPGSEVYLRIKVSDYGSRFPLSKKFGVDPLHAVAYMDMAAEKGLKPTGLAFHVGSQSENPHSWAVAFETCGEIIKKLSAVGIDISFINIGGGFPASYTERINSLKQIADIINKSITKHIPDHVKIVAEPGRFISATSSVIVTSVIGRETRGSSDWLFIDMGVFQGLLEPLEIDSWRYPIFTNYGKKAAAFSKSFVLTGPTCDAYDTLGLDYELPSNLKMGDRLYIGSAGAYTKVYASNFNGFSPPKTYYLENQK